MDVFKVAAAESFEQRMIIHVTKHFTEQTRHGTQEQIRNAVRQGVLAAQRYGMVSERHVAKYIDISMLLGLDFDSGSDYPWATEILNHANLTATDKLDALINEIRQAVHGDVERRALADEVS
jgi:hypothetical protein